jgi:hypothetical protein
MANVASSASSATTASTSSRSHASTYVSTSSRRASSPSVRSVACWLWSGQLVLERRPRALQRAVDRRHRRVQRLGDLLGREAEDLAQDEHRALGRRQVLERDDERELDALALLVARVGAGQAVGQPERLVRVRLDPHGLDQRLARADPRVRRRAVVDRQHPAWAGAGSASRQVFVAIVYSQERSELRPSKRGSARHARSDASCRASSASCTEPSIR